MYPLAETVAKSPALTETVPSHVLWVLSNVIEKNKTEKPGQPEKQWLQ